MVLAQLEKDIINRRYMAGEKLPGLPVLAKKFSVSYGTVHKAVRELEEKRLVTIKHGAGTFVRGNQPSLFDLIWFIGPNGINDSELLEFITTYINLFNRSTLGDKAALNLSFLDVRTLPRAETLVSTAERLGVRGCMLLGHGSAYLNYALALAKQMPTVSLFGHWEIPDGLTVATDNTTIISDVMTKWQADGMVRTGFAATQLEHPNYRNVYDETKALMLKSRIDWNDDNCFVGKSDDFLNWIIGRLSRPAAPRYWITASEGMAAILYAGAEYIGLVPGKDISVLTFAMQEHTETNYDSQLWRGIFQLDNMMDVAVNALMNWQKKKNDCNKIMVPMRLITPRMNDNE